MDPQKKEFQTVEKAQFELHLRHEHILSSFRPKRVLYAGRIHPEKGVLNLVGAWKKLPESLRNEWVLRLIGPWKEEQGGAGSSFLDQLKKEVDPSIEFLEPVFSEKELIEQYQKARIFVYPSIASKGETFGLAVLEAMSCGSVPLVSSLPCFDDFIRAGENGYRFDAVSYTQLTLPTTPYV